MKTLVLFLALLLTGCETDMEWWYNKPENAYAKKVRDENDAWAREIAARTPQQSKVLVAEQKREQEERNARYLQRQRDIQEGIDDGTLVPVIIINK